MPFYDLKCDKCSEEFNVMAKMSDRADKLIKCPNCGCNELSAVFKNINIGKSKSPDSVDCPNVHKCGGCCNH